MLPTDIYLLSFCIVGETLGKNDHFIIRFTLHLRFDFKGNNKMTPNFKLANFDKIRQDSNVRFIIRFKS